MTGWMIGLWVLCSMVLLVAAALTACSYLMFRMVFDRKGRICLEAEQEEIPKGSAREEGRRWLDSQHPVTLHVRSHDGLTLAAEYIPATTTPQQIAIVVHGYTDNGLGVAAQARMLQQRTGCALLLPNLRAHGQSEGRYVGFGWPDRLDLMRWIDKALQLQGEDCKIALMGVSMGAATVLMAAGEKLPPQVRCVISDCGYSSAEEELSCQMRQMLRLPVLPFLPLVGLICTVLAGYRVGAASAERQVQKTRLPILFIHGAQDTFVPTRMVHDLYAAAAGPRDLLIVPGAAHCESFRKQPEAYEAAVLRLWHTAMGPQLQEAPLPRNVVPFPRLKLS